MRATIFLSTLIAGACSLPAIAQAPDLEKMDIVMKSVPNGPVAKVRGVNISRDEYVKFYTAELGLMARRKGAPLTVEDRAGLGFHCLRVLIQHELLYQEAQRLGLRPSDAEVRDAWTRERDKLRERILRQTGETVSDDEVLQRTGYQNERQVLREVRRSLMIERMSRRVLDDANIEVDESLVNEIFQEQKGALTQPGQLHLQQVFFRAEDGKGPQARKARREANMRAVDAYRRLQTGERFGGVVRRMSEGSNKDTGGHMGPLPTNQFPPFMVEAVKDLQKGQYTSVIESEYGFHIVRLVDRIEGSEADPEKAQSVIRSLVMDKEGERIIGEYCETLVKDPSELEVFLELERNLSYLTE